MNATFYTPATLDDPDRRSHYEMLRKRGFTHEQALKLAHGNLVNVSGTDNIFLRGSHLDDGFGKDELTRRHARARARAAGVNPEGKKFFPSLCRRGVPNDPLAWHDSKGSVKQRVIELGRGCEELKVAPLVVDEPGPLERPYRIDPKIVAEDVAKVNHAHYQGRMPAKEKADLTEKLTKQYTGSMT